ncbi:Putative aminopeptidase [Thermococcus barophilus]|uniref:Aminopeptidase n=1 Tax=Thermococcus barophilus TaxID=55802 RepID=A0A0S1XE57_THEBA|nr:Putative aminopeptidase [Thermococcus barophilus]
MKPTHILLTLVLIILVASTVVYSHKNRNSEILSATELTSFEDYASLRAKVMSEYNYPNYEIVVLFNLSLEKSILGVKGNMVEQISFSNLILNEPIWVEIYIPEKVHLNSVQFSHINILKSVCYKEWCLLLINPLSKDGAVTFNYSFRFSFTEQNEDAPFNDPYYTSIKREKIALPLSLASIGINSATTAWKVSFLLFKTPWEDAKAFLIVNQTLIPLTVGEKRVIPTPQNSQFLLFAGRFKEITGNTTQGITIRVYYPLDEVFEIFPGEVLNWSKDVISTYVYLYSIVPSGNYYIINWNTGKAKGNGFLDGIIVGMWSAKGDVGLNKMLMAHELAHSWFGGYADFGVLNEALATFSDLYVENKFGENWYSVAEDKALYGDNTPIVKITKNVPEYQHILYYKGALIFRSLQFILGNETFFEGLRELLNECHGKECNLTDVQAVFENVSGRNLNWFFKEWFYSTKVPNYDVRNLKLDQKGGKYFLNFEIIDKNNFTMPLEVKVLTSRGRIIKKVWVAGNVEVSFELEDKPLKIILDPNEWMVNINRREKIDDIEVVIE